MELDLDRLDPELAVILPALPAELADINRDNIGAVREMMGAQPVEKPPTTVRVEERTLPSPNGDVRVFVYSRPSSAPRAGMLWIHGGGYLFG